MIDIPKIIESLNKLLMYLSSDAKAVNNLRMIFIFVLILCGFFLTLSFIGFFKYIKGNKCEKCIKETTTIISKCNTFLELLISKMIVKNKK